MRVIASLSDILSTLQNGVVAINNFGLQMKGTLNNILSRFNIITTNVATNTAAIAVLATPACFSANKGGTNQTLVADSTFTAVTFGTELYDVGSHFASDAWTPPSGKVHISAAVLVQGTIAIGAQYQIAVYKNGVSYKTVNQSTFTNVGHGCISFDDTANGTDVYTVFLFIDLSAGTGTISGLATGTYFTGHWFSA